MSRAVQQKSCGIVPVHVAPDGTVSFLLLNSGLVRNPKATWEFPKGAVEPGESEVETALRECGEETGLVGVRLVPGYRALDTYSFRREGSRIRKRVVYFLALVPEPGQMRAEPDGREHVLDEHGRWYQWVDFDQARRILYHEGQRAVLATAWAHLTSMGWDRPGAGAELETRDLGCLLAAPGSAD